LIEDMGIDNLEDVELFDVYRGSNIEENKKSLAYSMIFRSHERTLKEEEVNRSYDLILNKLKKTFNVKLR